VGLGFVVPASINSRLPHPFTLLPPPPPPLVYGITTTHTCTRTTHRHPTPGRYTGKGTPPQYHFVDDDPSPLLKLPNGAGPGLSVRFISAFIVKGPGHDWSQQMAEFERIVVSPPVCYCYPARFGGSDLVSAAVDCSVGGRTHNQLSFAPRSGYQVSLNCVLTSKPILFARSGYQVSLNCVLTSNSILFASPRHHRAGDLT
jgi:hypothetical protein